MTTLILVAAAPFLAAVTVMQWQHIRRLHAELAIVEDEAAEAHDVVTALLGECEMWRNSGAAQIHGVVLPFRRDGAS